MQTLQELQVWFVLPGIRRELANALKAKGVNQKKIALILDITEAAVSQYVAGKRGNDMTFDASFKREVELSAQALKDGANLQSEVQRLLRLTEHHRSACSPCPEKKRNSSCEVCYH